MNFPEAAVLRSWPKWNAWFFSLNLSARRESYLQWGVTAPPWKGVRFLCGNTLELEQFLRFESLPTFATDFWSFHGFAVSWPVSMQQPFNCSTCLRISSSLNQMFGSKKAALRAYTACRWAEHKDCPSPSPEGPNALTHAATLMPRKSSGGLAAMQQCSSRTFACKISPITIEKASYQSLRIQFHLSDSNAFLAKFSGLSTLQRFPGHEFNKWPTNSNHCFFYHHQSLQSDTS